MDSGAVIDATPSPPTDFDAHNLLELYSSLGQRISTQADASGALFTIASVAVASIPNASYASITRGRARGFETVVSTDPMSTRADLLQYELLSGPCVDAVIKDHLFRSGDLRHDDRWPVWGPAAFEQAGVNSVLSMRLLLEEDDFTAALNVYSDEVDAFDETTELTALLLAAHGAVAVSWHSARQKAAHLEKALSSNREIGMAMGVIMNTHKLSRDQAFNLLRIISQNTHTKLHDVAREVADTGVVTLPEDVVRRRRPVPKPGANRPGARSSEPTAT